MVSVRFLVLGSFSFIRLLVELGDGDRDCSGVGFGLWVFSFVVWGG